MNIFLTVGTTRFDSLVSHVENNSKFHCHSCILQIGRGGVKSERYISFEYTDEIDRYYCAADVVVSHAGAGSIYRILELRRPLVIVPNTDRLDPHQIDIANFMDSNGYALSVFDMSDLYDAVLNARNREFKPFERDVFFSGEDIISYLTR